MLFSRHRSRRRQIVPTISVEVLEERRVPSSVRVSVEASGSTQPSYNPYITVDYLEDVTLQKSANELVTAR